MSVKSSRKSHFGSCDGTEVSLTHNFDIFMTKYGIFILIEFFKMSHTFASKMNVEVHCLESKQFGDLSADLSVRGEIFLE